MLRSYATVTSFLISSALIGGCSSNKTEAPTDSFDRAALLSSLSNQVVLPTLNGFQATVPALETAIESYCVSLESTGESVAKASAQQAWRESMAAWQRAEVMNVGPGRLDSQGLRDEIYSWNITSPCSVDQATLAHSQSEIEVAAQLPNRRGLDALEYLLFNESTAHSCESSQSAPAGWDALSAPAVTQARCDFALALSTDLAQRIETLLNAWTADDGFIQELQSLSAKEALDDMALAVTYLERQLKELKIETPLGITENSCFETDGIGAICPQDLESPFAQVSMANVIANLEAFIEFFTGKDGVGFDDMLTELGSLEVSESILQDANAALSIAQSFEAPFTTLLSTDNDRLLELHTEVQSLNTTLKTQFLSVTGISFPSTDTDND